MYMMLGFGDSEPPDNGTSFSLFAFFAFVLGFVIFATTTFEVFREILATIFIEQALGERCVCLILIRLFFTSGSCVPP